MNGFDMRCAKTLAGVLFSLLAIGMSSAVADDSLHYSPSSGTLPFSESVRVGETIYLSGLLGVDEQGKLASGGVEGETAQILKNLDKVLAKAGSSRNQVVRCTVILADIKDFAKMNTLYAAYFPKDRLPTRTTFASNGLVLDAKIEIECLAVAKR